MVVLFAFIYLYLFTLHVFYFNIPDLNSYGPEGEGLSRDRVHTQAMRLSLHCFISLFILYMCTYNICACMYHLLHCDRIYTQTHTHNRNNLPGQPVCVHLGLFGALSCHMLSAWCCARPCLGVDTSKKST